MKVALTGVSGHVGAAVLRELLDQGHEVRALLRHRDLRSVQHLPVEIVSGDLLNPEALVPLMDDCTALVHCAAMISIHGDQHGMVRKTNVDGVRNVLHAARAAGIRRVIHVSSIHAFEQQPRDELLDETRAYVSDQAYAYDRSKREGQRIALAENGNGMEIIVVNPTAVVGPFDYRPSRMGQLILDLLGGRRRVLTPGGFDFCDVREVSVGIVNALDRGTPGTCYLLGGKWQSLRSLAELLGTVTGTIIRPWIVPAAFARIGVPFALGVARMTGQDPIYTHEALTAVFQGNRRISSVRAMNDLDYRVRPLEETLRDTVRWFVAHGYLESGKYPLI